MSPYTCPRGNSASRSRLTAVVVRMRRPDGNAPGKASKPERPRSCHVSTLAVDRPRPCDMAARVACLPRGKVAITEPRPSDMATRVACLPRGRKTSGAPRPCDMAKRVACLPRGRVASDASRICGGERSNTCSVQCTRAVRAKRVNGGGEAKGGHPSSTTSVFERMDDGVRVTRHSGAILSALPSRTWRPPAHMPISCGTGGSGNPSSELAFQSPAPARRWSQGGAPSAPCECAARPACPPSSRAVPGAVGLKRVNGGGEAKGGHPSSTTSAFERVDDGVRVIRHSGAILSALPSRTWRPPAHMPISCGTGGSGNPSSELAFQSPAPARRWSQGGTPSVQCECAARPACPPSGRAVPDAA